MPRQDWPWRQQHHKRATLRGKEAASPPQVLTSCKLTMRDVTADNDAGYIKLECVCGVCVRVLSVGRQDLAVHLFWWGWEWPAHVVSAPPPQRDGWNMDGWPCRRRLVPQLWRLGADETRPWLDLIRDDGATSTPTVNEAVCVTVEAINSLPL